MSTDHRQPRKHNNPANKEQNGREQESCLDLSDSVVFARKMSQINGGGFPVNVFYDYLIVVDFECTCEDNVFQYEHEIIEFPAVLYDVKLKKPVDEFRSFVKPLMRPILHDFAVQLTGVTQADVDSAPPFLEVLDAFRRWCYGHGLGLDKSYAIVTDGLGYCRQDPWDLGKFLQMQCLFSGMDKIPHEYRHYINLRRSFTVHYRKNNQQFKPANGNEVAGTKSACTQQNTQDHVKNVSVGHRPAADWLNLQGMLDYLGLVFEGRPHCGIDDCRNIARILDHLVRDGAEIRINERLMGRERADRLLSHRHNNYNNQSQTIGNTSNRQQLLLTSMQQMKLTQRASTSQQPPTSDNSKSTDQSEDSADNTTDQNTSESEKERLDRDRQFWREHLPYKTVTVTKHEFLMQTYLECDSCNEEEH